MVELQGGEIGVSSESGRGSTFAFYIKVRRSCAPPKDAEDPLNTGQVRKGFGAKSGRPSTPRQSIADSTAPPPTPDSKILNGAVESPLRILIVEDNLVNQKVLAKQLQKLGCVVHLANHGGEAIDRLQGSRFWKGKETSGVELDVILMDLEMPVMDGLTCTRKIRELQLSKTLVKHVPVIAVTANAREEQIATTREAGVVGSSYLYQEIMPMTIAGRCHVKAVPHPRASSQNESFGRRKQPILPAGSHRCVKGPVKQPATLIRQIRNLPEDPIQFSGSHYRVNRGEHAPEISGQLKKTSRKMTSQPLYEDRRFVA